MKITYIWNVNSAKNLKEEILLLKLFYTCITPRYFLIINKLKKYKSFFPIYVMMIFHLTAETLSLNHQKMEIKQPIFSSTAEWKMRTQRAHVKIRDDANSINIRRINVSCAFPFSYPVPVLLPFPHDIIYESPFKTSRALALFEFIFHVSWLIQTRSNHHLQKTWRKLRKGETFI